MSNNSNMAMSDCGNGASGSETPSSDDKSSTDRSAPAGSR
jgi:hypothetical protein